MLEKKKSAQQPVNECQLLHSSTLLVYHAVLHNGYLCYHFASNRSKIALERSLAPCLINSSMASL